MPRSRIYRQQIFQLRMGIQTPNSKWGNETIDVTGKTKEKKRKKKKREKRKKRKKNRDSCTKEEGTVVHDMRLGENDMLRSTYSGQVGTRYSGQVRSTPDNLPPK